MIEELIIEGQHVDLLPDTDITLEYVNNIVGDIGKINLSRSYTVKIPNTARNARILDDPGHPAHESGQTRRFLTAYFYRNGIKLIGPAQAYILKAAPDAYEIALVWNTLESLQELSQSDATLNDLPDLPVLAWIGQNGMTPDYTGANDKDGALFAAYNSGLGDMKFPAVNAATHPCMRMDNILSRIFNGAGVPYRLSYKAASDIKDAVILAAPKHQPTRQMEMESGSLKHTDVYYIAQSESSGGIMYDPDQGEGQWQNGWDAITILRSAMFAADEGSSYRILLNLQTPQDADFSNARLIVRAGALDYSGALSAFEDVLSFPFISRSGTHYVSIDEEINLSGWTGFYLWIEGAPAIGMVEFSAYDDKLPLIAINRVHPNLLDIANDNRFPLQGNLPDIKQWDFIKACMAMFGWVAIIFDGRLELWTYPEVTDFSHAYDWTAKVDMTDSDPQEMNYTIDNWAQINKVTFQIDSPALVESDARLKIQDTTLPAQRDWYELPFGASMQSNAQHYEVKGEGVNDVDISPRVFRIVYKEGVRSLEFTEDMYGEGLVQSHYARLQEIIQKPVILTQTIRLSEIDLAQLELTCPVYLGQYGRYYAILKIQTSKTDLCKVELLQLP